jgi:hypothetical protein
MTDYLTPDGYWTIMADPDHGERVNIDRRRLVRALGGAGLLGIAGCSGDGDDGTPTETPTPTETDDGTGTPGGGTDTPGGGTDTPDEILGGDYEPPAESEWPPRVEPSDGGIGPDPPGDATILYDGDTATLEDWEHSGVSPLGGEDGAPAEWYDRDGYFETNVGTGDLRPSGEGDDGKRIGDCHLHLEWRVPEDLEEDVATPVGNSGIFMMQRYEIAINNNNDNDTQADKTAGAYYASDPALSLPIRPVGEWQEFDILWRAPRFDEENNLLRHPMLTMFFNGVCVNAHVDVLGPNWGPDGARPFDHDPHGHQTDENGDFVEEEPFYIQEHNSDDSRLHWRNVWYRDLPERPVPDDAEGTPLNDTDSKADTYDTSQGEPGVQPEMIDAGGPGTTGTPPEDAEMLFDSLALEPGGGGWESEDAHGDSQLHLEWKVPEDVDAMGPFRGNSGAVMMGNYEISILDTADNPVEADQWAGAYTHGEPPHHDAVRDRGEWNHLDIVWQGPDFEDGTIFNGGAQVTALLNGVAVQTRLRIAGPNTDGEVSDYAPHDRERPLSLAEPDSETRFRNGWIRSLL